MTISNAILPAGNAFDIITFVPSERIKDILTGADISRTLEYQYNERSIEYRKSVVESFAPGNGVMARFVVINGRPALRISSNTPGLMTHLDAFDESSVHGALFALAHLMEFYINTYQQIARSGQRPTAPPTAAPSVPQDAPTALPLPGDGHGATGAT